MIDKLLSMCLFDESSISAKMSCQSIAICFNSLSNSKYGFYSLLVLQQLLTLKHDAYLLVKSKVLLLFSKIDFHIICALEEKSKDQTSILENNNNNDGDNSDPLEMV